MADDRGIPVFDIEADGLGLGTAPLARVPARLHPS